ncbi:hypothetical protein EA58_20510 [Photobacterium galatheae]|uniref:Uncharacterized protein n=1 Tax=Photobacterium galatheae TaxID=1654360 RepID=A0A066RL48_9GAMM|nr:hypothetical protein EA58_20510 [Photobacterium galatheae]
MQFFEKQASKHCTSYFFKEPVVIGFTVGSGCLWGNDYQIISEDFFCLKYGVRAKDFVYEVQEADHVWGDSE